MFVPPVGLAPFALNLQKPPQPATLLKSPGPLVVVSVGVVVIVFVFVRKV